MEHNSPGILEDMIDSVIEKCNIPLVPKKPRLTVNWGRGWIVFIPL